MKTSCGKKYEEYKGLTWTSKAKLYHLEGNVKIRTRQKNESLTGHSILTVPLSTREYKCLPASELSGKPDEMLGGLHVIDYHPIQEESLHTTEIASGGVVH